MTSITTLRIAAALTHAAPGAECTLRCAHDTTVKVGRRPGADMSPCQFRAAAISMTATVSAPADPRPASARIFGVELDGALEEIGAGVIRTRTVCGLEQRWIATTLPWQRLHDALDAACPSDLPDEALDATGRVDHELGVAIAAITAFDRRHLTALDRVATAVATTCLVDELVHSTQTLGSTGHRAEFGSFSDGEPS